MEDFPVAVKAWFRRLIFTIMCVDRVCHNPSTDQVFISFTYKPPSLRNLNQSNLSDARVILVADVEAADFENPTISQGSLISDIAMSLMKLKGS